MTTFPVQASRSPASMVEPHLPLLVVEQALVAPAPELDLQTP